MTFEKRLAVRALAIEAALAAALADGAGATSGVPARLAEAMRHAVMGGGKRLRPFLVIETAEMLRPDAATRALSASLALEMIHCYSLVHDDLPAMDNDELRRGKPTVWKAFDEWTAILAGDALLTLAFELLGRDDGSGLTPAQRLQLVTLLSRAAGAAGMVGGQALDLDADKRGLPASPDVAHVERLQAMKTGALFRFACEAGAVAGGADAADVAILARFGATLGAAFQLADDLLDVEGDADKVGKTTGKDAAAGKATLVELLGVEGARQRLGEIERAGLTELDRFGSTADVLRDTLRFACARDR